MSVIFTPTQGVDFARVIAPEDYEFDPPPANFLQLSDVISVTLWPASGGPASALPYTPTGAWIPAAFPDWVFSLPGATSARLLPGRYRFLATVSRDDGQSAEMLAGDIILAANATTPATPAASPVIGLPTAATLGVMSPVWCSDEDIAIRCGPDLASMLPQSNVLAAGSDGVFAASDPWTLTSGSNDFGRQLPSVFPIVTPTSTGISIGYGQRGYVVRLLAPSSLVGGSGQTMAVAGVLGGSLTLRRLGLGSNLGMAPAPAAGCSGVRFEVLTFAPQIEEATFRINQRFRIDSALGCHRRGPLNLEDIRPLRQLCVARVLYERYMDESRKPGAEYAAKAAAYLAEIDALEEQLSLRWDDDPDGTNEVSLYVGRYCR